MAALAGNGSALRRPSFLKPVPEAEPLKSTSIELEELSYYDVPVSIS
jgi:hypothetical protein